MPAPAAPLLMPSTGDEPSMSPRGESARATGPETPAASDSTSTALPVVEWRAHPAAERPSIALAALLVIAMLSLATGMAAGTMAWSLLAAFLLLLAVRRFFLSSHHIVDHEGVTASHLLGSRSLRWSRIRRVVVDDRGGFVGTMVRRSWLDPIRGIHLTFPTSMDMAERERVADIIRTRAVLVAARSTNDRAEADI